MKNDRSTAFLRTAIILIVPVGFCLHALTGKAQVPSEQPDNYTWLEDIRGDRPLAWVKAENARSAAVLTHDPHFAPLQADALKVLQSPERLPEPVFRGGFLYNTWQDASHVRGIVRRTTLADYLEAKPHWQTVLDYDALAVADKQSWVGEGFSCLAPEEILCMASLSAGGEDAQTAREINLTTGRFVDDGFVVPRSKQDLAWLDKDTLLVSTDWGPGTMSDSGYPISVRRWMRGTPLASAIEVYRGQARDTQDSPAVLVDGQGHRVGFVVRHLTFFECESYLLRSDGPKKLALPPKAFLRALVNGQIIVSLDQDWTNENRSYPKGSILSVSLEEATRDPEHLHLTAVFTPTAHEFAEHISSTKTKLLLTTLDNVQGRASLLQFDDKGIWRREPLQLPDNRAVDIAATSRMDDRFFLEVLGFLTPPSLYLGGQGPGALRLVKSQPPLFDGGRDVVEQWSATSKDGTRVPYFVVHPKDMPDDGNNPVLLDAYGGFGVSNTPYYSAVTGKLWLEHGGTYVLANIRGGGEFGPAWHEAGLKTHRQRIYDDFYAVAQDLVSRKVTSTRRLGIIGGSNGGLLMGVEFTQHPEMWGAVVIRVPLLDMLAYEHLSAGASWVGEYGSVSNPEEHAFLASISPYNQLKREVLYPEPLIFTTTADDRVGPVHARKFAARLEEFGKPFFYDEIVEGGHGMGADPVQEARSRAEYFTYLTMKLMH